MKLRNKKTGEIMELECITIFDRPDKYNTGDAIDEFYTLAELNEEWEDYEEPKEYWYLENDGDVDSFRWDGDDYDKRMMLIGNCFETKEEAKKAVEKLKAWKRLKDKGFRFIDHIDRDTGQGMTRYEWNGYINGEDLDLLFSGEDD